MDKELNIETMVHT